MDFFQYIAAADPADTAAVIQSYGYDIHNQNLAECARDLVNLEGEEALKSLVSIHPDRDIIVHYFGGGTGAKGFHGADGISEAIPSFSTQKEAPSNRNDMMLIFLMGGFILITAAIITK